MCTYNFMPNRRTLNDRQDLPRITEESRRFVNGF